MRKWGLCAGIVWGQIRQGERGDAAVWSFVVAQMSSKRSEPVHCTFAVTPEMQGSV